MTASPSTKPHMAQCGPVPRPISKAKKAAAEVEISDGFSDTGFKFRSRCELADVRDSQKAIRWVVNKSFSTTAPAGVTFELPACRN